MIDDLVAGRGPVARERDGARLELAPHAAAYGHELARQLLHLDGRACLDETDRGIDVDGLARSDAGLDQRRKGGRIVGGSRARRVSEHGADEAAPARRRMGRRPR